MGERSFLSTAEYIGIVHGDAASGYGISFPDLPGCHSVGDDIDALRTNAAEAIELFLDGEDVGRFPASERDAIVAALSGEDRAAPLLAVPVTVGAH